MKRSIAQDLPSQEARPKMSRHDPEDVKETPKPTTNIFLVETVLRKLFKQIESVSKLKDLRKICQLWDRLDTEELEERAFKGGIKAINLTFSNKVSEFKPIKDSCLKMRGFLDDTSSNPRLFRSFAIVFPSSLALLNLYKFRWFYKDYSPTFFELAIPQDFKFNQDQEGLLKELLRWAAPTLRELVFVNILAPKSDLIPSRKSLPVQSFNFPHLRKMSMIYGKNDIMDAFKAIFIKENHPETPSLTSLKLSCCCPLELADLISNPTRWATLTMLEIRCYNNDYYQPLSKLANGLLSLAQAGMTLNKLDLGLCLEKYPWDDRKDPHIRGTFRDLSEFFASQARSLEALKLTFKLDVNVLIEDDQEGQIKILLPVFERLHTLYLDLDTRVYTNGILTRNIFEFGLISQHFPALKNLNILNFSGSLDAFLGGFYEEEEADRMNLKWLNGMNLGISNEGLHLDKYFGSVEAFASSQVSLQNNLGMLGDLVDTIRVLHIRNVNSVLDLSQFKGLRRLVIMEGDKIKRPIWNGNQRIGKLNRCKGLYLGYFKKVAELGLDSIMFRGLEMIEGQSYKEFAEAFPFRVESDEKSVDWLDRDFIDN